MDAIKFDKEEFLNSEIGQDLCDCIEEYVFALVDLDNYEKGSYACCKVNVNLTWCYSQWLVYERMLKYIYGVEYHFFDTEECAGLCTKDGSDWLIKVLKAGIEKNG